MQTQKHYLFQPTEMYIKGSIHGIKLRLQSLDPLNEILGVFVLINFSCHLYSYREKVTLVIEFQQLPAWRSNGSVDRAPKGPAQGASFDESASLESIGP